MFNVLAVVGSRTFTDYALLKENLDKISNEFHITKIVSGGAQGADSLARKYAQEKNILLQEFKPDWQTYGKAAGMLRNTDIVNACDMLVAFWDGVSPGTRDSIKKAEAQKKRVLIVTF